MQLTPAQTQIAQDSHRFRVVNCGRRFGKTTEAVEEIKGVALFIAKKGDKIAYIAPTYQQARDIAWEMLKKELLPITKKVNESRLELEVLNKEGEIVTIILRGWEAIETLRGQKFIFLVLDEVASMRNFWIGWQEVLRPALADTRGGALFISTPKGFNHFYDLYNLQGKDEDYKSFHFTTYDNPFIPKEEIDKAKIELPEDRFHQEYMADFRKREGLVYPEFDRTKHVFNDLNLIHSQRRITDTIAGIDFGFTNPTAILTIEIDQDKRYLVIDEFYKSGKTNEEVIEYAKTIRASAIYPDPAEPDRIEEMRRKGLNVREVSKDVEAGIDTVRNLLKQGRLLISNTCVNLISEFETYAYKEKRPNTNEPEEPIKEHDHALDALRYALHMKDPEPKEDFAQLARIMRNRQDNMGGFK